MATEDKDDERDATEAEEGTEEGGDEAADGEGAEAEGADEAPASEPPAAEEAPAPSKKASPKKKAVAASEPEEEASEPAVPERMRRARPRVPLPPPPAPAASLGKSVGLFAVVVFGLGAGFYFLGKSEAGGDRNVPKWKVGQEVSVDITLDPRDDGKLACASKTEIAGKRCEFEAKGQKTTQALTDATQLRPYTTTDGIQFVAAGLWSHPELEKGKRPADRFTVRCKLKVEGTLKAPAVRWDPGGPWNERPADWMGGTVSGCTLVK